MTLNASHRLATVKSHKATVVSREAAQEAQLAFLLSEKDHEISRLCEPFGQADSQLAQRLRECEEQSQMRCSSANRRFLHSGQLEKVKGRLAPLAQMAEDSCLRSAQRRSQDFSLMNTTITFETPISRPSKLDVFQQ